MSSLANNLYRFGDFVLDAQGRVLSKGPQPVLLTPKAFDVLLLMVRNAGRTVSKDELMKAVWPNSFVEESNLTQTVFMIRKALDETANRRYILTVQGQGYRFLVPVAEGASAIEAGAGAAAGDSFALPPAPSGGANIESLRQWRNLEGLPLQRGELQERHRGISRSAGIALAVLVLILISGLAVWSRWSRQVAAQPPARIMLAVLPFQNLTGDPAQEYVSDGLTEEMITQLGNLNHERLGVIGRTSVMHYKDAQIPLGQIGRELNAQYVLEGSYRRDADRVRITAKLIQVKDQTHLWAREYDRQFKDLLSLEGDVTQQIATDIQLTFDSRKETGSQSAAAPKNFEAYDLYLKGLYFFNKRTRADLETAIQYFKQAVVKDSTYARAYAGLAKGYAILSVYQSQPEPGYGEKARAAALKALELDDRSSEAHTALALIVQNFDWDWKKAESEFRRAIELNPNDATAHQWYAEDLMWRGRFSEALEQSARARRLDPLSLIIAADDGAILFYSRNYDAAIEEWRSVREMDPDFVRAHLIVGAYVEKGMFLEAKAENESARSLIGEAAYWSWCTTIQGRAGNMTEARQALEKLLGIERTSVVGPMAVAQAFAGVRDKEQTLMWLERAYEGHSGGLISLRVDPAYDFLRTDARFRVLLLNVGLEQ